MDKQNIISQVTNYVRDHPHLNNLLEDRETSPELIGLYIDKVVSDFNTTPPHIQQFTVKSFPSLTLMIDGVTIELLISAGILYDRNSLDYGDAGGVVVRDQERGRLYKDWIQYLVNKYERSKREYKSAINLSTCWGGVGSAYSDLHGEDET